MSQNIEICDGCMISSTNFDEYLRGVLENAINFGSCHCKCLFGLEKSAINVQPPALTVASILNHVECVKALIEAGADVNVTTAKDRFLSQRTALSLAALMGHSDCVNALIAAGADVNKMDEKKFTALTFAAQGGHSECMKILIQSGADVNMDTGMEMNDIGMSYHECGRTALMWLFLPELPVSAHMEGAFYHLTQGQFNALNQIPNRKKCLEILLEAGVDVNTTDSRGHTALAYAARQPNETGCVKTLIDARADVNLFASNSDCPIIQALSQHCDKNLDLLLKRGANLNDEKANVQLIARFANSRCVKLLLKNGLLINKENMSFMSDKVSEEFYAAGVTSMRDDQIPDYVKQEDEERHLKHLCRVRIRNHLLELDPHENLFVRVPELRLPKSLASYLLFDVTMDDLSDDSDNDL